MTRALVDSPPPSLRAREHVSTHTTHRRLMHHIRWWLGLQESLEMSAFVGPKPTHLLPQEIKVELILEATLYLVFSRNGRL